MLEQDLDGINLHRVLGREIARAKTWKSSASDASCKVTLAIRGVWILDSEKAGARLQPPPLLSLLGRNDPKFVKWRSERWSGMVKDDTRMDRV